ncbi:hypothetical protein [Paenibacillus riograndensis]|uniref:Uncharacterized protein n=1 Tax=Paenibacillus riograndensis SBR5 TaxID=1073571 RepID=A0A0E4HE88_9BACL|nr:hypothetical protein [Paenibacillus riograndensis]CQR58871.1 hypothetical protein PRIO_6524 [Paenibacillus riograndensis SBR5]
MAQDEQAKEPAKAPVKESAASRLFTPDGKPLRVLSTSLGIALLANALFIPGGTGAASGSSEEPKLVSWSTEEVKAYFDKNVDWNIPYPEENAGEVLQEGQGVVTSGGTTVINNYGGYNSGFGWDDLLLYHMLFNSGSFYSSRGWYNDRPTYYGGTRTKYKAPSYNSGSFQNKPVAGSVVKPRTSTSSTGSITRRNTSSKAGGVGGKSSGLGSSKSGSSSSKSGSTSRSSAGKSSSGKSGFGG